MARTCTICVHENRHQIDQAVIAGRTYRDIANLYSVSKTAIQRHAANHLPKQLMKAKESKKITDAGDLLSSIVQLEAGAKRIQENAENETDYKSALSAIREQSRLLELRARMSGEIVPKDRSHTTVNRIKNVNIKALLLDPKSRQAIELLASKTGVRDGS